MTIEYCPFCGGKKTKIYLIDKGGVLRKCSGCKGIFDQDRTEEQDLNDKESDKNLDTEYDRLINESKAVNRIIAEDILLLLSNFIPITGNFLEVGCGTCSIGELIQERFPEIIYTGIEGYKRFYYEIDARLKKNIIFEKNLSVALNQIPDNSQNAIILNHVLEHLPQPKETIEKLKEKLAPGGILYVEVPNEQWKKLQIFVRSFFKPDAPHWFPGHINFFTLESLENLVIKRGLKILFSEKGRIGENFATFVKMTGGEKIFNSSRLAKTVFALLKATPIEKLINYGIVLRLVCQKTES